MSNPSEREADMVTPNDDDWAANMRLHGKTSLIGIIRSERRDYEDQITRDRALIQSLVDALADPHKMSKGSAALDAAKEQGFTPTEG